MRYTTTALAAAALLATTCAYAQQGATPVPQAAPGSDAGAKMPGHPGAAGASADQDQLSKRLVRHIQTRLKQQGYYDGSPDGVWDSDTVSALEDYQDANGLPSSGQLDGPTIYILGIATPPYGGGGASPQQSYSGSSGPPSGGGAGMQAAGMGAGMAPQMGGGMAQQAPDQMQQQSRQGGGGPDLRQVAVDAYQQGYQQGVIQGFRQAQAILTSSQGGMGQGGMGPGQGSSQPGSQQQGGQQSGGQQSQPK